MSSAPASLTLSLTAVLALGTGVGVATGAPTPGASSATSRLAPAASPLVTRTAYLNPVSKPFADTFADPSLIRGKDGWWYAYGTSDPLRAGQDPARIPITRSRDLVSWRHVGDAFTATTLPSWAAAGAGLWGPDIRYVNGQYRMYYVVTDTTATSATSDNAIGMATAPTPAGPWIDSGAPVVGPRPGPSGKPGDYLWTFDPSVVTDTNGSQWMFFGSYYGGVFVQRLSTDGRTTVGRATRVGIDNKFEGAYAVHRGGYWYLFASTANCCAGPTTGYSVQVGRSRTITGPYVDAQGVPLDQSRAGGTPVLNQNGNRWVGSGHNAIAQDLAGQDWIVYHAIDRGNPYLVGTSGINRRPMLMDRLDWVHGWPAVRAGRGPSDTVQRGPATGGRWATTFAGGLPATWWTSGFGTGVDPQSGRFALSRRAGAELTPPRAGATSSGTRVEADLRSPRAAYGLQTRAGRDVVTLQADPASHTVRLQERRGDRVVASRSASLGATDTSAWHSFAVQVQGGVATATVTNARLGDPVASLRLALGTRSSTLGDSGAVAGGASVGVDNLSVLPAAVPVPSLVKEDVPNRIDRSASDEFSGRSLKPGWTWVRKDNAAKVVGGHLVWRTEKADLTGAGGTAGVLLRDPGSGGWAVETKVSLNTGTDTVLNFAGAGLIAYVNDDLFTRLSNVAIWDTRQTEFGKEMPYAGGVSYGGTIVGPPAATTWLRITHHVAANGEHDLRAWTSRDGHTWVKGGVWTLPTGSEIKVGLVSHGLQAASTASTTARFDFFRLYRD